MNKFILLCIRFALSLHKISGISTQKMNKFILLCLRFALSLQENNQRFKKMFGIGTQEILIIALIILLLFGGKKIPELMRGLGKGVKSFKEGMNDKDDASETIESPKDQQKDESSKE